MNRQWIDITMGISPEMVVYKNKPEKKPKFISRASHMVNGYQEGSIEMDLHLGTHVDMPKHILSEGHDSSEFDVGKINGECLVIDLSENDASEIKDSDLENFDIQVGDIIILKTKNSFTDFFNPEFDYLGQTGAELLKDKGVKAVGIDALGIERGDPDHGTHKILLSNKIYIIEGLALADVSAGRYTLYCFPLKIEGVEGLPSRAFLGPSMMT